MGYAWLRACVCFAMYSTCVLSVSQTIPTLPSFSELPSISDQSELIPLRPFLLNPDHSAVESVSMRGKSVKQGPTGWMLEYGVIESKDRLLLADQIQYNPKTSHLEARGNIRFEGLDFRLYCSKLEMDWDKKSGEATDLKFEILLPNYILKSDRVRFKTLQKWEFNKATISPAIEENPGWKATTSNLKVDLEGYADCKNLLLRVFNLPTCYFTPYLMYPVKAKRASGFLLLSLAHRSIGIPYYQVLGSTADATVFPRFFGKCGVFWDGEVRWNPDQTHKGSVSGSFIKERQINNRRYCLNIKESWQRDDGWRFAADINRASDNFLDFDYNDSTSKLGESTRNGVVYLGKSFSWGNASISAAQQKSYVPPYYLPHSDISAAQQKSCVPPHYLPQSDDFSVSMQREIMPSVQGTINPILLGSFYVDGDIRIDNLGYKSQFGSIIDFKLSGIEYDLIRSDIFLRAAKSFYSLGLLKTNLRFGGRLTHYSKTLELPFCNKNLMGLQSAASISANRVIGSTRVDFSTPAVGRIFQSAKTLCRLREVKHIVTPYLSFLSTSKPPINGYFPHFDGVDSQPGISGSAAGEHSMELGLNQYFFYRSTSKVLFSDLLRWNISAKFNFSKILLPQGEFLSGWGSINNDVHLGLSKKLLVNLRIAKNDGAISADYSMNDNIKYSLASWFNRLKIDRIPTNNNNVVYGTHNSKAVIDKIYDTLARQKGIQVGAVCRFCNDTVRLESLFNYDFNQKYFVSSKLVITYDQPCVSESLGFYHTSRELLCSANSHKKEDGIVFTVNLHGLGDLFKIPL